jgi:hypothetical protein
VCAVQFDEAVLSSTRCYSPVTGEDVATSLMGVKNGCGEDVGIPANLVGRAPLTCSPRRIMQSVVQCAVWNSCVVRVVSLALMQYMDAPCGRAARRGAPCGSALVCLRFGERSCTTRLDCKILRFGERSARRGCFCYFRGLVLNYILYVYFLWKRERAVHLMNK